MMDITLPIKIFVAHPSKDKESKKVIKILEDIDFPLRLNIFPSVNYNLYFPDAIRRTIEETDILLAIFNKKGLESPWVNQEVGIAVANDIDIVILAESKEAVKGFVHKNNKDILLIQEDDLEEELIKWLRSYQEKNILKILERLIGKELKNLRRIIDEELFEGELNTSRKKFHKDLNYLQECVNLALSGWNAGASFMKIEYIAKVRGGVDKLTRIHKLQRFVKYIEGSDFLLFLDEYFKVRGFPKVKDWTQFHRPEREFKKG